MWTVICEYKSGVLPEGGTLLKLALFFSCCSILTICVPNWPAAITFNGSNLVLGGWCRLCLGPSDGFTPNDGVWVFRGALPPFWVHGAWNVTPFFAAGVHLQRCRRCRKKRPARSREWSGHFSQAICLRRLHSGCHSERWCRGVFNTPSSLKKSKQENTGMSRKTPVIADVGNSAGYWGVRSRDGAGRELN